MDLDTPDKKYKMSEFVVQISNEKARLPGRLAKAHKVTEKSPINNVCLSTRDQFILTDEAVYNEMIAFYAANGRAAIYEVNPDTLAVSMSVGEPDPEEGKLPCSVNGF